MSGCCDHDHGGGATDTGFRRILWLALVLNAAMFAVEALAVLFAGSVSLQGDALVFLGGASAYAITLVVLPLGLAWRARAALFKAACMGAFGLWVIGQAVWHLSAGSVPDAGVMAPVAVLAFTVNVSVAALLFRHRGGDANRRSIWLCSRNDAVANLAVLAAAAGVFGTGAGWPDVLVAGGIAGLALTSAATVARQAAGELRRGPAPEPHDHTGGHAHVHGAGDD